MTTTLSLGRTFTHEDCPRHPGERCGYACEVVAGGNVVGHAHGCLQVHLPEDACE